MIQSPVLIIGCPRSGTTLLFNILSEVPSLWSIGYESKAIIEHYHHPRTKNWSSGALDARDLTPESRRFMLDAFERQAAPGTFWRRVNHFRSWLRDNRLWRQIKQRGRSTELGSGVSSAVPQQGLNLIRRLVQTRNTILPRNKAIPIQLLEKTPENCLRLPFLLELFPDARIIYLTRNGPGNVNSLLEGWKQPHLFRGYQVPDRLNIPGYSRDRWAFTLIPGWRELTSSPLEEVCAWQWIRCNEAILVHREQTQDQVPYLTIRYQDLISEPAAVLPRIADFLHIDFEETLGRFTKELPQINIVTRPDQEKWRRQNPEAIGRILPLIEPMMQRLGYDSSS
jgi:hypothetical protein